MSFWYSVFSKVNGNYFLRHSIKFSTAISKTKTLIVLDGWGEGDKSWYNAIYAARTPNWDLLCKQYPKTLLHASGSYVGLPASQPGNSEAGHIHMGAGSVIKQDLSTINAAIADGSFARNPVFIQTIHKLRLSGRKMHVFGLLSPGGTHSHERHLLEFLDICYQHQFTNVLLHIVIDGRDPKQFEAGNSLNKLKDYISKRSVNGKPVAQIASMVGRQYALNRNNNWDRTAATYDLLTAIDIDQSSLAPMQSLEKWYQSGAGGISYPPTRFMQGAYIDNNDAFFVFNYRADRVLQIVRALMSDDFTYFHRKRRPIFASFIGMMPYANDLPTVSAFVSDCPKVTLGKLVSQSGERQLRIAESEKAAHVGALFNGDGGSDTAYNLEERLIVTSPIASSYDTCPEMSATLITDELITAIKLNKYALIIANFANIDILGHTGNLQATIKAVEHLDVCLGRILKALQATNSEAIITADHGNGDIMYDVFLQKKHTAHTSALVPCVYVGPLNRSFKHGPGSLIDIAPTMLEMLRISKPKAMTGQSLFKYDATLFKGHCKYLKPSIDIAAEDTRFSI